MHTRLFSHCLSKPDDLFSKCFCILMNEINICEILPLGNEFLYFSWNFNLILLAPWYMVLASSFVFGCMSKHQISPYTISFGLNCRDIYPKVSYNYVHASGA